MNDLIEQQLSFSELCLKGGFVPRNDFRSPNFRAKGRNSPAVVDIVFGP